LGKGLKPFLQPGTDSTDPKRLTGITWAVGSREALRSLTDITSPLSLCPKWP